MNTSRKLKIWMIILHGLMILGFGHGGVPVVAVEIMWFPYVHKPAFSFLLQAPLESRLCMVGLTTLLGQALLVWSILAASERTKRVIHLAGLALLWLSIVYFMQEVPGDGEFGGPGFTAIPFVICTLIALTGGWVKRTYRRWLEK